MWKGEVVNMRKIYGALAFLSTTAAVLSLIRMTQMVFFGADDSRFSFWVLLFMVNVLSAINMERGYRNE